MSVIKKHAKWGLILDTSRSIALAGVCKNGQTIPYLFENHPPLSASLPKKLGLLLDEHGATQLEAIAVGIGPGSYTGTRSGVSFLQGLSVGLGLSAPKTFCSLLCAIPPEQRGKIVVLLPAKSGAFFLLAAQWNETLTISKCGLMEKESLAHWLEEADAIFSDEPLWPDAHRDYQIQSPDYNIASVEAYLKENQTSPSDALFYLNETPFIAPTSLGIRV